MRKREREGGERERERGGGREGGERERGGGERGGERERLYIALLSINMICVDMFLLEI